MITSGDIRLSIFGVGYYFVALVPSYATESIHKDRWRASLQLLVPRGVQVPLTGTTLRVPNLEPNETDKWTIFGPSSKDLRQPPRIEKGPNFVAFIVPLRSMGTISMFTKLGDCRINFVLVDLHFGRVWWKGVLTSQDTEKLEVKHKSVIDGGTFNFPLTYVPSSRNSFNMAFHVDMDIPSSPFRSYFEDVYFIDENPRPLPAGVWSFRMLGLIISTTISSPVGPMLSGLTTISTSGVAEDLHLKQMSLL